MQVKKFEAANMKEALAMVKRELGPEAIILSAKDNSKGFGLRGQSSVEITAAISEKVLQKKKLAERKLKEDDLQRFHNSNAHVQKKFIDKVYDRAVNQTQAIQAGAANAPQRSFTSQRYIDIVEEQGAGETVPAAKAASLYIPPAAPAVAAVRPAPDEVQSLKNEISRLKQVIAEFQKVPQNFISVHPGAEKGVSFEFSAIFEKLRGVGMDEETVLQLIDKARQNIPGAEQRKKPLVDAWMAQEILRTTQIADEKNSGFVQVFVGASGQGKTSSLVKLASQLVIQQGKRVALLTADTFKVGAADQLKIFAQILNVPFATVKGPQDWHHILSELKDYDHLLMDFPAVQMKEIRDIDMIRRLLPPEGVSRQLHFVVSATSKGPDVEEMVRRFRIMKIDDVIFTKLDEAVHHGLIYDFQRKFGIPLHSFGIGPRIPEDFERATRERVLDLLFRLTKIQTERGDQ